jgi:hypothetical protein
MMNLFDGHAKNSPELAGPLPRFRLDQADAVTLP